MKNILIYILIVFFITTGLFATDRYIRASASGEANGSDWTNAWTDLPASLNREDTYYIADGSYSSYTFDDAEDGTKVITIKKATVSDHGTETGWNPAYGDGQAIFAGTLIFSTGYYTFNGNGTHTVPSNSSGDYGFKIGPPSGCGGQTELVILSNNISNITIKYAEFENCGDSYQYRQTQIYNAVGSSNITVSHNYFHDYVVALLIRSWSGCVIERNYFGPNWRDMPVYGEPISSCGSSGNTLRYNIFEGSVGSGVLHVVVSDCADTGWVIHGNVHFDGDTTDGAYSATHDLSDSVIYNNTFVDFERPGVSAATGSGNYAYNNVYYNCTNIGFSGCTHDYNASDDDLGEAHDQTDFDSADFVNYANDDFRLSGHTDSGTDLGNDYDEDMEGTERTNWDRGAFEYDSGGAPPAAGPSRLVMILSQIQIMPIFWAWYAMAWFVLIRMVNRFL